MKTAATMSLPPKEWLPQDHVLVRFKDDPELLHWRCILHCVGGNRCIVVTPDRDVQEAVLEIGGIYIEIKRMVDGRLFGRVREK